MFHASFLDFKHLCSIVPYKYFKNKFLTSPASSFIYFFLWRCGPTRTMASSFLRFLDHTQSVRLLWTNNRLVADTSTGQHTTQTQQTNIHALVGIGTHSSSIRAAADLRLRLRGLWAGIYNSNVQKMTFPKCSSRNS
jgi:hypothetical protein